MISHSLATQQQWSVGTLERQARINQVLGFGALASFTGLIALLMLRGTPAPIVIAWLLYLAGLGASIYNPRYGVYLILALTLIGDWIMIPWYPFWKNFSSEESIFYLHPALIVSPLETYIIATYGAWLGRALARRKLDLVTGPLFWPILVFAGFVVLGLAFGLLQRGNLTVALWEARPIIYLPLIFLLASSLIKTRAHVNQLLWLIGITLFVRGIIGVIHIATILNFKISGIERIGNHAMSIYFDSFFVLVIAVWLFRDSLAKRLIFPLMLPPIVYSFFANQRRASFIALMVALLLLTVLLYRIRRRLFWRIVPVFMVLCLCYIAVFWNSYGTLGFPVQTLKSTIGLAEGRNAQSNLYRDIENANIMYTIRNAPLGVGFGRKFLIIYPLPDISFFEWWEYITHNSVLWIWMKMGPFGFISMLFMYGMAIIVGTRSLLGTHDSLLKVAALVATFYVLMHCVYATVDMSWDSSSMVYVGVMLGLINVLDPIAAQPLLAHERRWPWQSLV